MPILKNAAPTPAQSQSAGLLVLYVAAFVGLAWPWLSGALTIPWDAKSQFQPELQFLARSLARGESPFWTPNIYAGWPQIADPQSLMFSPLHLALAALTPTPTLRQADLVTFAYLFAGSLAIIMYFRDRGWHPGGAVLGALIFAFGASASSRLQHTGQIISLAYLPIALWLVTRMLERTSWRYGLAAGLVIGLLAADRDQVAMLGLYVIAGYVLAFWIAGPKPPAPSRLARVKATLLPLAASGGVAVVIAIVPVVMSALLAAQSNRPEIGFDYAGRGSLHPAHLLTLMFSDLYGAADPNIEFWGPPSPVWSGTIGGGQLFLAQNMGEVYCGILAILLIAGMGIARGLLWAREIRFFLIALAICLVYALGWYTPIFRGMYDLLPGIDLFRRPADATFVIGLMIAINTGYLVHRLLTGTASRWHFPAIEIAVVVILASVATAIAFAAGELREAAVPIATGIVFGAAGIVTIAVSLSLAPRLPFLAAVLLLAFTAVDLAWNRAPDESSGLPPSRYDALQPQTRDATVALLEKKLAQTAAPDRRDRVELIAVGYHWPNLGLARGFDHLFGQNPLRLQDFARATGVKDTVAEPAQRPFTPLYPSYRSAMADLFGVRFILTGVPVERIDPDLRPGDLEMIARTADAYIYENPRALPRVMFLHDYRVVDFDEIIRSGWPAGIDPRRTLLLAHAPPHPPAGPDGEGTARIVDYRNTEVTVEVASGTGGFLLLTDAWHPWWRAEIDGVPAPILKADVLFRAVEVAPGRHRVRFTFHPFIGAWEELRAKLAVNRQRAR
ncbi:MAG: hypothetical protein JO228_07575 [Xanthobacteraceae bacterium]|nr:hypothetical protein [Xanthobacteraceae bacterium]